MIETARDFIARRLGEDLIGPLDSDEVPIRILLMFT